MQDHGIPNMPISYRRFVNFLLIFWFTTCGWIHAA